MADMERLRYVTGHYFELQGLRFVPVGGALIALGAAQYAGRPVRVSPAMAWLALLIGTIVTSALIGLAYHHRYGFVQGRGDVQVSRWLTVRSGWLTAPAAFVVVASSRLPPFANASSDGSALWVGALVIAVVSLYVGVTRGSVRGHYLPIGVAFILVAWASFATPMQQAAGVLFEVFVGLAIVLAGLGDHLVFRSVFPHQRTPRRVWTL